MKITVYDGADTIGGNKIHLEEDGKGLFLDFGLNFARYGKYYEEYINDRIARGIYDLWNLDLIPKLNIYRGDMIPRDLDISNYPRIPVNGVLLSHGHLDHAGNISLLDSTIPIISSSTTAVILKAINDTSGGIELPYYKDREIVNDYIIRAKIKSDYKIRKLIITDRKNIEDFMFFNPGKKEIERKEIDFLGNSYLGFEIKSYPVDHSIFGAMGFIIEGDIEIAYTGDFRLHGERGYKTEEFVNRARDASILITEGTRVTEEKENISEKEVYDNSLIAVENSKNIVVADFSARNFERMISFYKIARKTGRELIITPKDAYFLHFLKLSGEIGDFEDFRIYNDLKARRDSWDNFIREKYDDKLLSPFEIRKNGEKYILCFSFYDMPHLLDINPKKGTYIYSSSEAFTEEQTFSFERLWNWLRRFKFVVYGFKIEKSGLSFDRKFHASGHISRDELIKVIEKIDPDIIIPVHTEDPFWFKENFENPKVFKNGESMKF